MGHCDDRGLVEDTNDLSELTELETKTLELVRVRFPVSWAPYCDLAEELGASEVETLNTVLELRETGIIGRIGADFDDDALAALPLDDAEQSLAFLLEGDIPYGEHPFAELAEMLQMQGIDVEENWVLERTQRWFAEGVIHTFRAGDPLEEDDEDGE